MASISQQQRLIRLSKSMALLSLELSNPPKVSPTTLREVLFAPTEESTVDSASRRLPTETPQGEPARAVESERGRQSSKRPTLRRQSSAIAQQRRQSSVRFELSAGGRLLLPEAELDFSPRLLLLYFGAGWSVPCVSSTRRLLIAHRAWSTQSQASGAAAETAAGDEALDEFELPAVLYVPSDEDEQSAVSSFRSSHGGWFALAFNERCAHIVLCEDCTILVKGVKECLQ